MLFCYISLFLVIELLFDGRYRITNKHLFMLHNNVGNITRGCFNYATVIDVVVAHL